MGQLFKMLKMVVFDPIIGLFTWIKKLLAGYEPPPATANGLTVLCPITNGADGQQSCAMLTRQYLQDMPLHENSPMAKVPDTYLCRFYILNDVFYEAEPAIEEHLKSKYLVFSSNYYGDLDTYLEGMWRHAEDDIRAIWRYCVAFDQVNSAADFVRYMKKCQVKNHLFFNGSTVAPPDEPDISLDAQLKALYLKQEFSRFAYANQGKSAAELQQAFHDFVQRTQPNKVQGPTWVAGADKEMVKS